LVASSDPSSLRFGSLRSAVSQPEIIRVPRAPARSGDLFTNSGGLRSAAQNLAPMEK
jgi:hypothetical protein